MGDTAVPVVTAVSGGAPIRTRSRSIGGTTYDEQYVLVEDQDVETGLYLCHVGSFTIASSAQASTGGFFWLVNTSASTVLRVRKVKALSLPTAASAFVTAPRLTLERMSFTGTPSGATVAPGKRINTSQNGYVADATAVGSVRTASTGMTITAAQALWAADVGSVLTAVGFDAPIPQEFNPEDKETPYLASGEGIVVRQADAGSSSDTRVVRFGVVWEEVTLP